MRAFQTLIAAALLCGPLGGPLAGTAAAQNPSADQIIRSLRPTGPSGTTRGIRPAGPSADAPAPTQFAPAAAPGNVPGAAPRAAAPARTAPLPPAAAARAPSVNLTVQFATGSAELTPAAIRTLDELGRALTSSTLSGFRFRIEGHTDTVGTREGNQALSDARAAKVLDYLAGKFQVDRAKIETVGMGQEHLLVRTGPNVPQPQNRRVTVINLGA